MTTAYAENQRLVAQIRDIEHHLAFELRRAQHEAPGGTFERALQCAAAVLREMRGKWMTVPVVSWPTPGGTLHLQSETTTAPDDTIPIELGRWLELQANIARIVFVWIEHGSLPSARQHVVAAVEDYLDHEGRLTLEARDASARSEH